MDIFVRCSGKLYMNSELLFVLLVFDEKNKFWKNMFCSTDIKTYGVQSEAIENQ